MKISIICLSAIFLIIWFIYFEIKQIKHDLQVFEKFENYDKYQYNDTLKITKIKYKDNAKT